MSFEDFLEERKRSAIAVFHRFRLERDTHRQLNLFVEGFADSTYYQHVLDKLDINDRRVRITYGKRNMDRIIEWFYAEGYEDTRSIFLRDSDFDAFLASAPVGDHVFLTCGYSVENYVCSSPSLEKFYRQVFCVAPEFPVSDAVEEFLTASERLFRWLTPLIGAILYAIRAGRTLDLDKLDTKDFFKTALSGADMPEFRTADFGDLGLAAEDFNDEAEDLGERFCSQDAMLWLRGHQTLIHCSLFLARAHETLREQAKREHGFQMNRRISPDFSPPAVFERLASLAVGTDRLREAAQHW